MVEFNDSPSRLSFECYDISMLIDGIMGAEANIEPAVRTNISLSREIT